MYYYYYWNGVILMIIMVNVNDVLMWCNNNM